MPFGSIFSKFKTFEAETADGQKVHLENGIINKLGLLLLGMPHMGMRLRSRIIAKNLPKKIGFMLDAGCGTGIYSFSLASKAKKIKAVDISNEKIKYLKSVNLFKNIEFEQGDLCDLKLRDKLFGVIICSDVLEHIKKDNLALAELSRVLAKDGELSITLPFNSKKNKLCYKKYGHEKSGYTLKDIERFTKNSKLKVVKVTYYSYPLADRLSEFSYGLIKRPILLALLFYPLYLLSIISENFKYGEPNGLFIKLKKANT